MSALTKAGYTPDKLDQIANFDPANGNNYLQHLYESTATKPTAPDEKKMRNARLWAGIADGVGLLSQMWSAGKGAHIRERDYKDSALSQVTGKEKEARDKYESLSKMYEDGLLQARMNDFLQSFNDYRNDKKGIQGVVAAQKKFDQEQAQLRFNYDKLAQDQQNKEAN
jgi:hypothetical protein